MGVPLPRNRKTDFPFGLNESIVPNIVVSEDFFQVLVPIAHTLDQTQPLKQTVHDVVAKVEREVLVATLLLAGGNKAQAARMLHIDYKTIQSKINIYRIHSKLKS
ncbi:MAG: helix-turn-helix domain-containing protein [Sheuella sp.]|nr:helix-turn-helix domain-containing protein [Sheuella sp.]